MLIISESDINIVDITFFNGAVKFCSVWGLMRLSYRVFYIRVMDFRLRGKDMDMDRLMKDI